jgi:hypothetical protein
MFADLVASFLLLIIGTGILIIWLVDINNNPEVDCSNGFFRAREKDSNNIFWLHIAAELFTGLLLNCSGLIILLNERDLFFLIYFSCGALFYTSISSLGWAFAYKRRYSYAFPMIAGLIFSILIPLLLNL